MTMINTPAKIYIAGHRGMVGSAIVRQLLAAGHAPASLITRTHAELEPGWRAIACYFINSY